MGTSVTGRFALDTGDVTSLTSLRIVVTDEDALFRSSLNKATGTQSANSRADTVQSDGRFTVTIDAGNTDGSTTSSRTLTLNVYTSRFRKLWSQSNAESASDATDFGTITLVAAEVSGYTVTLGKPKESLKLPVREGGTVRPLIDGEDAWSYLRTVLNAASTSIYVLQLAFDTPKSSAPNSQDESPEIVLAFDAPYDPASFQAPTVLDDARPEQILITKMNDPPFDVRVIMSGNDTTTFVIEIVALAAILTAVVVVTLESVLAITVALIILDLLIVGIGASDFQGAHDRLASIGDSRISGKKGIAQYLKDYGSKVDFQTFPIPLAQWVHSKMVIVDGSEAIGLGSPFHQSYWDTRDHFIYDPRRGSASDEYVPVHDISMAVKGPVVSDMHDSFRLHWNVAEPKNKLKAIPLPDVVINADLPAGEYSAPVQVVRTLNGKLFDGLTNDTANPPPYFESTGEQGVLEAYLRAIENAQKFIYLENQYFTNKTIAKALVAALNDTSRKDLVIIVLLNVTPDAPFYPFWQWRLITQIRKDAGTNADRIGFFTVWSHDVPFVDGANSIDRPKPMIAANYLHSKFGMVDGTWLTVGSANLDGLSLDTCDYLGFLPGQARRDHELNICIFNGIDGASATDAIDAFRRNLWGEHLGLDPTADELKEGAQDGSGGWLELFHSVAAAKAKGLASDPATIQKSNGRILEYPTNTLGQFHLFFGRGHGKAVPERDFLAKSGVTFDKLDLVPQVRGYDFGKKHWA